MEYNKLFQLNVSATVHNITAVVANAGNLVDRIAIQINVCDETALQEVLNYLFVSNQTYEVLAELHFDVPDHMPGDNWLNNFTNILCHLRYTKIANKLLISYQPGNQHSEKTISHIQSFLETQGFNNLLFIPLNEVCFIDDICVVKFTSESAGKNEPFESVSKAIKNTSYPLQAYFSISNIQEDMPALPLVHQNVANALNKPNIDQEALYRVFALRQELDNLTEKNMTLQTALLSNSSYVDYLKNIIYETGEENEGAQQYNYSEMIKIKKFYHREYEILPLWYKRFGHIIKVLMGKRSFKSLFNDNVKKYKT